MKLIHRSSAARDPVRNVSSGGQIFVGVLILIMFLSVLGDLMGPLALSDAGMELALFDMGTETVVLALHRWSLLEMMLAAAVAAFGISVIRTELRELTLALISAVGRGLGKIPI